MPPVAILGGAALLGAGASVVAANKNSKAINKSTDANLTAQREALAAQQQAADQNRELISQNMTQAQGFQREAYNSAGQALTNTYNQGISALNPAAQTGYAAMNQRNAMLGLPDQGSYTIQQAKFTPIAAPPVAAAPAPQPAPATTQNALAPQQIPTWRY